jgi:hypothetical protein
VRTTASAVVNPKGGSKATQQSKGLEDTMNTFNIEEHKEDIEGYVKLVNDTYDPENGDVYPEMLDFITDTIEYLNISLPVPGLEDDYGIDAFEKAWDSIADVISQGKTQEVFNV